MKNAFRAIIAASSIVLALPVGCKKAPEPDGYLVTSYDGTTHHWTIVSTKTIDGKRLTTRLTVVCMSWQRGEQAEHSGPEACDLRVGELIVPNPTPTERHPEDHLTVEEMTSSTLVVTKGKEGDDVQQWFEILKNEMIPNK